MSRTGRRRSETPAGFVIATGDGWLYLAVILDLFTRKVVGWAMRGHMRAELTIARSPWRSSDGARDRA